MIKSNLVKFGLIGVSVLVLSSLCYSYFNDDIDFATEMDRADFCADHLDHSACDDYKPMFVLFYNILEKKHYPLDENVLSTYTLDKYRYTSDYKRDFNSFVKRCKNGKSDFCDACMVYLKDANNLPKAF